jgi:hypothetical protein
MPALAGHTAMIREDIIFPDIDLGFLVSDEDLEHLGRLFDQEKINAYIKEEKEKCKQDPIWQWARANFFNEDETPWEMSPGELAIFKEILFRKNPRVEIITGTQYGKTITVSRAVLSRITSYAGDVLLLAPDQKRGHVFLNYMIKDTARNEYFAAKLEGMNIKENNLLTRLLTERSKTKLTYQIEGNDDQPRFGSVEIITCEAKRKENAVQAIMGFGGRTIIADEAALVDDAIDAAVLRMMAGKGDDTFLCKIGNPFFRNHFLADWLTPRYIKIYVDYHIALAEGRYTQKFLDEAMPKPNSAVFYLCEFPAGGIADAEGWMMLMSSDEIKLAMQEAPHFGEERAGCDVADEGNNESVIAKRSAGYAEILYSSDKIDPNAFAGQIILNVPKVKNKMFYIDRVGVGSGTYHRTKEVDRVDKLGMIITGVNAGEEANDKVLYSNKRAEMYWRAREWIKGGGKLSKDARWYQLAKIPYRPNSGGKIEIMPKKEMRSKKGIPSPDVADSLSLTFYDLPTGITLSDDEKFFLKKMAEKKRKSRQAGYGTRYVGH